LLYINTVLIIFLSRVRIRLELCLGGEVFSDQFFASVAQLSEVIFFDFGIKLYIITLNTAMREIFS